MTSDTHPARCLCEWTARTGVPGWRLTAPFRYCPDPSHRRLA